MKNLASHYSKFKVNERILLTGHSHQAWPDCAFDGQMKAYEDAANLVDAKWTKAFQKADRVREGFKELLKDPNGLYSLAPNTHDLLIRFLSSLDLKKRPRLVTTDSEFHSMKRQLARLEEEGIEVVWVNASPTDTLAERMIAATNDKTAAVLMSAVFYNSGVIARGFKEISEKCEKTGSAFLVDSYHALNVAPFTIAGIEPAFILGGGYKYCQLGEGNCFLRFPADCALRPAITGWMADFDSLEKGSAKINYSGNGARFAGSTYDPVSHYRAAEVFDFFKRENLTPEKLREISQRHMKLLCEGFDDLGLDEKIIRRDRTVRIEDLAGFLALTTPKAKEISEALAKKNVFTDYRGNILRLGSAPYVSVEQLESALQSLKETTDYIS